VHADHLSTPRYLTNAAQQVVWRSSHAAFGAAVVDGNPDGDGNSVEFNFRFPGQYYDSETGLHYNYFRYYDPSTGRYITSDPIGLNGGLNTYGYVGGNPVLRYDSLGLLQSTGLNFDIELEPAVGVKWWKKLRLRLLNSIGRACPECMFGYGLGYFVLGPAYEKAFGNPYDNIGNFSSPVIIKPKLSCDTNYNELDDIPFQLHHYATNKNKNYTPAMQEIAGKYGLDLDGGWNKELMPHLGRHPNLYHDFVLDSMRQIDIKAQGDVNKFLNMYESNVKDPIKQNPNLLNSDGWK